ncbi:MAG: molecular chaperone DjiA [Bacteroidales bacterium]|jgi:DnaJ like chaperone protein|nr:molecular chaperone DjiA [Bacteroidales bacterium]
MTIILIILGIAVFFFYLSNSASKNHKVKQRINHKHKPRFETQKAGYGKWIGGGLGWALGGPIGGLLGFYFGSMFEGDTKTSKTAYQGRPYVSGRRSTQSGDFSVSLLVLSAAVMKADGIVKKSELDYVKRFFVSNFGETKTVQLMQVLKDLLDKDINIQDVSVQVRSSMDYSSRLQLLHYLFGIAGADMATSDSEILMIQNIAGFMGVTTADFNSVKAMFVKDTESAYMILEITPDANDNEVKKAYHKMAIKYHPDKVSHLGEEVQKAAEEKFQKLNAAYEEIKKRRGIN